MGNLASSAGHGDMLCRTCGLPLQQLSLAIAYPRLYRHCDDRRIGVSRISAIAPLSEQLKRRRKTKESA
jgi:hypothetical protein